MSSNYLIRTSIFLCLLLLSSSCNRSVKIEDRQYRVKRTPIDNSIYLQSQVMESSAVKMETGHRAKAKGYVFKNTEQLDYDISQKPKEVYIEKKEVDVEVKTEQKLENVSENKAVRIEERRKFINPDKKEIKKQQIVEIKPKNKLKQEVAGLKSSVEAQPTTGVSVAAATIKPDDQKQQDAAQQPELKINKILPKQQDDKMHQQLITKKQEEEKVLSENSKNLQPPQPPSSPQLQAPSSTTTENASLADSGANSQAEIDKKLQELLKSNDKG